MTVRILVVDPNNVGALGLEMQPGNGPGSFAIPSEVDDTVAVFLLNSFSPDVRALSKRIVEKGSWYKRCGFGGPERPEKVKNIIRAMIGV